MTNHTTNLLAAITAYDKAIAEVHAAIDHTALTLANHPLKALTNPDFLRHTFKLLRSTGGYTLTSAQRTQIEDSFKSAYRTIAGEAFSRFRFDEVYYYAVLELNVDRIGGANKFRTNNKLAADLTNISHALDRAASTTLEIKAISFETRSEETFYTDAHDNNARRASWNGGNPSESWYTNTTYDNLFDAFQAAFTPPQK